MHKQFSLEDRKRIALELSLNEATLYQALTGRGCGYQPARCVEIERDSGGELRRWDLRPRDWHLIWPELIGTDGAPEPDKAALNG